MSEERKEESMPQEPAGQPGETAAPGAEEKTEQTSLPLSEAENRGEAILEGLLYLTGEEGLSAAQAAQALEISEDKVRVMFDHLMQKYSDDAYGIEIAEYGGIYRFLSKAFVSDYARRLFQLGRTGKLSQAALETLAIIAYKQPVTRVEIEEIRGVGSDVMLRKLEARDLIRQVGRSDAPGRPILYEVTEEFMNSFQLVDLGELPELPDFSDQKESDDLFEQ